MAMDPPHTIIRNTKKKTLDPPLDDVFKAF